MHLFKGDRSGELRKSQAKQTAQIAVDDEREGGWLPSHARKLFDVEEISSSDEKVSDRLHRAER